MSALHYARLSVARARSVIGRLEAGEALPGQQPHHDALAYQRDFLKGLVVSMAHDMELLAGESSVGDVGGGP